MWRRYDVMVCTLVYAVVLLRHLRLVSLLRKGALTLASLEYLVKDEADKLLELGFLEQRLNPSVIGYRRICNLETLR